MRTRDKVRVLKRMLRMLETEGRGRYGSGLCTIYDSVLDDIQAPNPWWNLTIENLGCKKPRKTYNDTYWYKPMLYFNWEQNPEKSSGVPPRIKNIKAALKRHGASLK